MKNQKPIIGITAGDPKGIGPELVSKLLKDSPLREKADFKIFGPLNLDPQKTSDKQAAEITFQSLNDSLKEALDKKIDAIVNAPVNKARLRLILPNFWGQTDFYGEACRVEPLMSFISANPTLRVAVATRHLPLKEVPHIINAVDILHAIRTLNEGLKTLFNLTHPKIAVSGLNPHSGEGGILGDEEKKFIIPAILQGQKEKIFVSGPHSGDTIFWRALQGEFDAVLAMYHDQGLAAVKTVAFKTAVPITLGLPFVRVTVDHGTAENLVGTGKADISNLKCAVQLAIQLASKRGAT